MTLVEDAPGAAPVEELPDPARWPGLRPPPPAPLRAAVARRLVRRAAAQAGVRFELGPGSAYGPAGGPVMRIRRPAAFFARLGRDGKIGLGEAYMAGDWDCPGDLAHLLETMARHLRTLVPPALQRLRPLYERRVPAAERNDLDGARRNISHHYDLSNEMFALFLDRSMTYSSALFADREEPLEVAQARKFDLLLDSTRVGPGSRVLEIGTGWGELALRAARRGALVTTLTLSEEQAELAGRRIRAEGLSDRVEVRVEDYRRSSGRYDAVVSVEMIEAVGERWWPSYFRAIDDRLVPGGRAGIQSILMGHDALVATRRSWTWIHKYIFPGGIIPSVEAISQAVAGTRLALLERRHFGDSYAETLRRWRRAFVEHWPEVQELGFDLYFRRMWEFYLAYSEAGFRSGHLDVAQLVYRKDRR